MKTNFKNLYWMLLLTALPAVGSPETAFAAKDVWCFVAKDELGEKLKEGHWELIEGDGKIESVITSAGGYTNKNQKTACKDAVLVDGKPKLVKTPGSPTPDHYYHGTVYVVESETW